MPGLHRPRLRRRLRVLDVAPGLQFESGSVLPTGWSPARVALMAHWSDRHRVSLSTCSLVDQLRSLGYEVVLVSAAEVDAPLGWKSGLRLPTAVYRRPNVGYDFGSWACGLSALPGIARADFAIMLNDSLLGPFAPLDEIIADFEATSSGVWALVDSRQRGPHLQSHFVGYRAGVLARPPLQSFWRSIRVEPTKQDIIDNYEIGLGSVVTRSGLPVTTCFPSELVVAEGDNPTIQGWRRLLLKGFPFVKREALLRPHEVLQDAEDIPRVIRDMFGQDIWGWV